MVTEKIKTRQPKWLRQGSDDKKPSRRRNGRGRGKPKS